MKLQLLLLFSMKKKEQQFVFYELRMTSSHICESCNRTEIILNVSVKICVQLVSFCEISADWPEDFFHALGETKIDSCCKIYTKLGMWWIKNVLGLWQGVGVTDLFLHFYFAYTLNWMDLSISLKKIHIYFYSDQQKNFSWSFSLMLGDNIEQFDKVCKWSKQNILSVRNLHL